MVAIPSLLRRRAAAPTAAAPRALGALGALGALLLAGCSLSTADDDRPLLTAQQLTAQMPPEGEAPTVAVTSGARFIQAQGTLVAPCQSAGRSSRYDQSGTVLTLRLVLTSSASCNAGPAAAVGYNAIFTNVPANTYTLRVVYEGDTRVASGTVVHEQEVVVFSAN